MYTYRSATNNLKGKSPNAADMLTSSGSFVWVALYPRVSSPGQVENRGSLTEQENSLTEYALSQGWRIYNVYREAGVTGHTDKRPAFQRMMNDARQHKFQIILFGLVNRFFREVRMAHNYVYEGKEQLGIEFISLDGKFDTRRPDYKHMLSFLADQAEGEWDNISARTKKFRKRQKDKHEFSCGRVKFGFKFNKSIKTNDSGHLLEDKPADNSIQAGFRIFTTGARISTDKLAQQTNLMPLALPRGSKQWTAQLWDKILTDAAYLGYPPLSSEKWQYNSPRIIESTVFEEAQRRIALNKHFPPERAVNAKAEFEGGKVHCGLCGGTIGLSYSGNKPNRYACRNRCKRGCILPRMKRTEFEVEMHKKIDSLSSKEEFIVELKKDVERLKIESKVLESNQVPIVDREAEIEETMKGLDVMYHKYHRLTLPQYEKEMDKCVADLAKLKAETDESTKCEKALTLRREKEDIDSRIISIQAFIEGLKGLKFNDLQNDYDEMAHIKDIVNKSEENIPSVSYFYEEPSVLPKLDFLDLAKFGFELSKFSKVDTYDYKIMPNLDNPKDREHPFIVNAEPKLDMQQGSGSTCSR